MISTCTYSQTVQPRSLEPTSVSVASLVYFPIAVDMVCHIQLFTAGAFLPVLGFVIFPCFIMDAMLMFKHRNGFGLNMVADRAVTCFGAFFGLGGRLRHSPFAVGMVCHIQLFTTGTLLPVI